MFRKNFLIGVVLGALLLSAAANEYAAKTATFPVLVNGNRFETADPVVVINGRTYLPLAALGDILGVPVRWNDQLRQVEIGDEVKVNNPIPQVPDGTLQFGFISGREEWKEASKTVQRDEVSLYGIKTGVTSDGYEGVSTVSIIYKCKEINDNVYYFLCEPPYTGSTLRVKKPKEEIVPNGENMIEISEPVDIVSMYDDGLITFADYKAYIQPVIEQLAKEYGYDLK